MIEGADNESVGAALSAICAEGGGLLTPQDVLDRARDPASDLHCLFEWNDDEADRLMRARGLILDQEVTANFRKLQDGDVR